MAKKVPKDVVATFSIVGFDPETEELGIAVQSKFLAVGAVVPWLKAGVGAVATQSFANTSYGPRGLELMAQGKTAEETLEQLLQEDPDISARQVGIVDAKGRAATYTGSGCFSWAGGITGENYAAQGNILVGEETVKKMGETFELTKGKPLAERLLEALEAGQQAGGDSRGMQSAALVVVKERGGYGGFNDRAIDLRVDDHPEPILELKRIYELQQLYFSKTKEEDIVEIIGEIKEGIIQALVKLSMLEDKPDYTDEELYEGLRTYIHRENFEEREQEQGKIDLEVYKFLLNHSECLPF